MTEFLQPAEDALLKGDYGTALYNAYVVNTTATKFLKDKEAARISGNLVALVQGLIEADFEAIAEQRGLTVTPENKAALLQEHSSHYVRFRELLTQPVSEPIPEIPYIKYSENPNIENLFKYKKFNSKLFDSEFYKILDNSFYNQFKNFRKK